MSLSKYDVLVSPVITEKAMRNQAENNEYTFQVDKRANKVDIKNTVESIYNVTVESVRVMNVRGKMKRVRQIPGRTASWKKGVVKLKAGDKIDFAN